MTKCLSLCRPSVFGLSICLLMPHAYADDEDTRFLLKTTQQQVQQQGQAHWQQDIGDLDSSKHITIDGQTYRIGDSTQEQELGIYHAINAQLWDKAQELLQRYRQQADHKPELILLVEGLQARAQQHFVGAIYKLEQAQKLAPHDARIQLELARLYTEDHQNQAATKLFLQLTDHPDLPTATKPVINAYIEGLQSRHQWHGSFSLGYGYNNNINQANGSELCVMSVLDHCFMTQSLPKPVGSAFTSYQLSLSRRFSLGGHHSLVLRPIIYGNHYQKKDTQSTLFNDYSENTSILYAGYGFKNARTDFTLSPFIEHYMRGGHNHYTTPGLELSIEHSLSPNWKINTQATHKRYRYSSSAKSYFSNYNHSSIGAGLSYQLSPSTSLYGGLDWTRRKYTYAPSSSKEIGARLGLFSYFESGFYINALAIYKDNRFDEKTFLSAQPRHDRHSIFIASVGAPKWNVHNIYPEIRFKHITSKSNIVFYNYRQNEVSLNFKYHF